MENRQDLIHQKGFAMGSNFVHGGPGDVEHVINYNKIKVGVKTLEDAVFNLGDLVKNGNRNLGIPLNLHLNPFLVIDESSYSKESIISQ